jgi:hypothetical protein
MRAIRFHEMEIRELLAWGLYMQPGQLQNENFLDAVFWGWVRASLWAVNPKLLTEIC